MNDTRIDIHVVTDRRTLGSHIRYLSSLAGDCTVARHKLAEFSELQAAPESRALFILDQQAWVRNEIRAALKQAEYLAIFWSAAPTPETELAALDYGAQGVLSDFSSDEEFLACLHTVLEGGKWIPPGLSQVVFRNRLCNLTRRESEITRLVTQGLTNKEIAVLLEISEGTVKIYLSRLFDKLGVADRYELALVGLRSYGLTAGSVGRESEMTSPINDGALLRRVLAPDRVWRPNRQGMHPHQKITNADALLLNSAAKNRAPVM